MPLLSLASLTSRWSLAVLLAAALAATLALPPVPAAPVVQAQITAGDAVAWSIAGPGMDEARHLAVDAAGNVYVTGVFTGTIDVDPGPETVALTSAGDSDIFLAKYAPDGGIAWAWRIGGPGVDLVNAVAVDLAGNVYVAGGFVGLVDFEPGEADASVDSGAERHAFVARYDSAGALVWVTPLGLAGDDEALSIALDGASNLAVVGLARMSASAGQPSSIQRGDLFALRLDADGRLLWSAVLPTASEGMGPAGVALNGQGEMVVAASYTGTLRVALGPGLLDTTSAGGSDIVVFKLTPAGALVWARSIGGPGNDAPGMGGLALDPAGNVAVTGTFDGVLDVTGDGGFVLESRGQNDVLVVSLDGAGEVRWATSMGAAGVDGGRSVVADTAGYVYITGWFSGRPEGSNDFDRRHLVGRGEQGATNGLLAKYTPDGQLAWARALGGRGIGPGESSIATGVTLDPRGGVVVVGRFFGTDAVFGMLSSVNLVLSTVGQADAFVAAFGSDGALLRR